jgi:hypothetical protein
MVRKQFRKARFVSESSGVAVDWFTICFRIRISRNGDCGITNPFWRRWAKAFAIR